MHWDGFQTVWPHARRKRAASGQTGSLLHNAPEHYRTQPETWPKSSHRPASDNVRYANPSKPARSGCLGSGSHRGTGVPASGQKGLEDWQAHGRSATWRKHKRATWKEVYPNAPPLGPRSTGGPNVGASGRDGWRGDGRKGAHRQKPRTKTKARAKRTRRKQQPPGGNRALALTRWGHLHCRTPCASGPPRVFANKRSGEFADPRRSAPERKSRNAPRGEKPTRGHPEQSTNLTGPEKGYQQQQMKNIGTREHEFIQAPLETRIGPRCRIPPGEGRPLRPWQKHF